MKRTFIYTDDKSNKFWTIEANGNNYTVNYGKVGTAGQTQAKEFADEAACQKAVDKLIAEKTKKGYVEQAGTDSNLPDNKPVAEKPTKQSKTAAEPVDASGLPFSFTCFVDIMKNGRAIEYRAITVNWDPYDKVEDPGGILIRADRMHYKVMPTAELAVIDALKIIAEKLSKGDKFSSCDIIDKNGEKEKVEEEQLREWIKIATQNGKDTKVVFNLEKRGDVQRYENAIKNGDLNQVKLFIKNGASVKNVKQSKGGFRPLDVAIEANQPEMVRFFIEKLGDKVYEGDKYTYFTSIATSQHNDDREQQVRLLVDNGYDLTKDPTLSESYSFLLIPDDIMEKALDAIDLSNDNGNVLIKALANSYETEARLKYIIQLIDKGANVKDAPEDDKETPLHWAAKKFGNNLNLIQLLIEKGADPNAKDKNGKTPLDFAITARPGWDGEVSKEVFEYLYSITDNFIPDVFDIIKSEVLKDKVDTIKLLLSKNADFNVKYKGSGNSIWTKNMDGFSPLQYAVEEKLDEELIEYLRSNTVVPELTAEQNNAVLHFSFDTMKSDELVNTLQEALENGADPNVQNENGDTFLHRIPEEMPDLWKYGAEFIELALKKGANVNIQNKEGKTPLMLFAATHYDKYIPLLLDAGADVNIQDNDGNTAVHLSHFNCLLPILKAKPDLMLANKKGVTAINRLRNEGYYYTDGFVYESKQSVKEAIDALGLDIPTDQQLQGVQWTPKAIDLSKNLPEQLSEASSYYFPYNDCSDELMYLGKNLLALVGGYPRVIHIFDVEKGKVVWCLNSAARMGYAIYDESRNVVYVARDGSSTANYITAHDPDTGKELWKKPCKLTNSSEQFGTVFVQNSTHIIHANIRKDVLYFVNKDTAKLDAKLNMENGVACSAYFTEDNTMCVYQNNLYVAGVNRKQDCFTVDKYDISTQTFTGTIFTSNLGERMSDFIAVDNILYLFDDRGILYKMDLTDGKIIAKVAHGTEGQKTPDDIRIRKLKRAGDKLVYTLRNYTKDEDINREYDLATDKISPYTPVKINEKGLKYGKEKWLTIKQLILGDSIFEVQKEAWSSSSKSCFLHRLN